MKKIFVLLLIVLSAIVIASIYGIIHDQFTYSISPEYYTKFKFYQFGLIDNQDTVVDNPRQTTILVGIMATWWMGLLIGLLLGLFSLRLKNLRLMFYTSIKAMLLSLVIALATGLIGLAYGFLFLARQPSESLKYWYIPDDIIDLESYIAVGSMHNFSYVGGLLGLAVAIIFINRIRYNSSKIECTL
jgi:tetrahydromethanopterin S-methyltransferase subunit F